MSIITKLLHLLQAETAHAIAKLGMTHRLMAPGRYCESSVGSYFCCYNLKNRLGLAAGFDKNGELVDHFDSYGFGFMEVGSVTLHGGKGNPKPRLFRLGNGTLLNRMGLNGDPAALVAMRLDDSSAVHYGVNITKTHNPNIMGDDAIRDVVECYKLMGRYGMYTALNISCPNTKEKTFEDPGVLRDILMELAPLRRNRPMLVKLSPLIADDPDKLISVIDICKLFKITGYICCNTMPHDDLLHGNGGMSGGVLLNEYALRLTMRVRELHSEATIIGCGGVQTKGDVANFITAGADLVQAYSGFVVGPNAGPRFAHTVLREHEER